VPERSSCERTTLSTKRRLSEIQELFFSALRDEPEPFATRIEPIAKLSPQECIRIYSRGYSVRLTDALGETFDATWWILGDEDFFKLSGKYIYSTVSHCYDLSDYGYDFPKFLSRQALAAETPFLPDLARFEWLFKEIFHKPNVKNEIDGGIGFAENSRFIPSSSAKLLSSRYPIYDIWKLRSGPIEELSKIDLSTSQNLLIYKQESQVRVRMLDADEYIFMRALFNGNSISATLDIALEASPNITPDRIRQIFSDIAQAGVLLPKLEEA